MRTIKAFGYEIGFELWPFWYGFSVTHHGKDTTRIFLGRLHLAICRTSH